MADTCLSMDKRLQSKIQELVASGAHSLPEVRRQLEQYVKLDLFAGGTAPPTTDARFWPSSKAMLNSIYRTRIATRYNVFVCFRCVSKTHTALFLSLVCS